MENHLASSEWRKGRELLRNNSVNTNLARRHARASRYSPDRVCKENNKVPDNVHILVLVRVQGHLCNGAHEEVLE